MFFVYCVYNKKHDKIYIGQSKDLIKRLELHSNGYFKHSYTSRFDGRWELIYSEKYNSRREVLNREKQLKSYRGREFVKGFISR